MTVLVESVLETTVPNGGSAVTVAVLATWPAFTSACVSAYGAVQIVRAPGASVETGHETAPIVGSLIVMPESVTLPALVMTNVYGMVAPALALVGRPACLFSVTAALDGIAVSTVS